MANAVRRRCKLLVVLTVLAGLLGYASVATPPVYAAAPSVLIGETVAPRLNKYGQGESELGSDLLGPGPSATCAAAWATDLRLATTATTWQELWGRVSVAVPVHNLQLVSMPMDRHVGSRRP